MAKLVLAGGTDVAEMALFDVDALVRDRPDSDDIKNIETRGSALRFPTGADGGYLLHAYLDEPIPADLLKYCVAGDRKSAILTVSSGNIGFGGIESLYSTFKSNANIRADGKVVAGNYDVTAYRTEYPDQLIEDAVKSRIGSSGTRIEKLPGYIIPIALVSTIAAFFASGWLAALCAVLVGVTTLVVYFRTPLVRRISNARRDVEMGYPSIVVHMRSNNALERTREECANCQT